MDRPDDALKVQSYGTEKNESWQIVIQVRRRLRLRGEMLDDLLRGSRSPSRGEPHVRGRHGGSISGCDEDEENTMNSLSTKYMRVMALRQVGIIVIQFTIGGPARCFSFALLFLSCALANLIWSSLKTFCLSSNAVWIALCSSISTSRSTTLIH